MEKRISYKDIAELIKDQGLSAEEIALRLGISFTHKDRDRVLAKVRRSARKAIAKFGGSSEEVNDENQKIYKLS